MKRQFLENAKSTPAINPQALTATANGIVIDRVTTGSGAYLTALAIVAVGAVTGSPDSYSVTAKVQHGDASDGSDMADVTGYTMPALTANNTNTSKYFDLLGLKRYIRLVYTVNFVGGTSPTIPVMCAVTLGDCQIQPAA